MLLPGKIISVLSSKVGSSHSELVHFLFSPFTKTRTKVLKCYNSEKVLHRSDFKPKNIFNQFFFLNTKDIGN